MNWFFENNADSTTVQRITVLNRRRAKTFAFEGGVGAVAGADSGTGEESIVHR
jgi:hypothetical protein